MKFYEIIIIFDYKNKVFLHKFILILKNILIYNDFIILNFENWGLLNLKYKIKSINKGYFICTKIYNNNDECNILNVIKNVKNLPYILRFFFSFFKKKRYFINKFCLKKNKKKNEKIFK